MHGQTTVKLSLRRHTLPSKYLPLAARECTQDQRRIRSGVIRKETFTPLNEEIKISESGIKRLPWYDGIWKIITKRFSCANPTGKIRPRIWLMQTHYGRNGPKIQPVKPKVENENTFIFTLYKAMRAQEGGTDIPHSFFNLGARWVSLEIPRPGRFSPCKAIRCPLHRWLCKTQDRSVGVRETSPPVTWSSTVQPVASHCTDYATPVYVSCATLVEPTPSQHKPLASFYCIYVSPAVPHPHTHTHTHSCS